MLPLLERFQNHTITLEECYQLRRFLERSLEQQLPISHQRVILTLTLSALNSLILDKETQAEEEDSAAAADAPQPVPPRVSCGGWWVRFVRRLERFFYGTQWNP